MSAFPHGHVRRWTRRVFGLAMLALVLIGSVGESAWAQVVGDTARTAPRPVEPARLDSLSGGTLTPPYQASDSAAADTGTVERAYVEADSLSTFQRGGERLQELFGHVFVRQDTTRIRSEYALRYLNRDEILFVNDVVIYQRGDTLRADTVRYNRATEVGHARGHVRLTNGDVQVRARRGTYYAREKRSVFPDSVTLVDSSRVLRAHHGTYWSDEERAEFGGGVRLTEPGTTLLADSLTYYRTEDRSIARGNVFLRRNGERGSAQTDTTGRTYLFGDWLDNQEQQRYSRVEGNALLVRVRLDSTGTPSDTLVVGARRLEAFRTDTHRRLVAVGSVRIWQPDLSAVADSAVYDRVVAPLADSAGDGPVPIDTTRPPPDSAAMIAGPPDSSSTALPAGGREDSLTTAQGEKRVAKRRAPPQSASTTRRPPRSANAAPPGSGARRGPPSGTGAGRAPKWAADQWDTPTARSDSALPIEETRLFRGPITWFEDSQVWGDSIRVRARNRQPDTVFVRGSAFAARRDSVLDRIQQLKAHNLFAFFQEGSLRRIRAQPNAQAIRFLASQNDSLNGAARTSGDRIVLRFREGSVQRISVIGGTQTTYFRKNENIPDPFELEGFQWTPERRPTRDGLLRTPRVQKRLDLDLGPRPRPVARSGARLPPRRAPRAPADSSGRRPAGGRPAVPDSVRRQMMRTNPPAADSLRGRVPVPPDSVGPSSRSTVSPDTSDTRRNLLP